MDEDESLGRSLRDLPTFTDLRRRAKAVERAGDVPPRRTIRTVTGGFGTGYTLGDDRVGMDPKALRFSKLVVLWGANVLSTNSHVWRPNLARKSDASIVSIDPIRTGTAAASDWHVAPMPGSRSDYAPRTWVRTQALRWREKATHRSRGASGLFAGQLENRCSRGITQPEVQFLQLIE